MKTPERRTLVCLLSGTLALALALMLLSYVAVAPDSGHAAEQMPAASSYRELPADQQTPGDTLATAGEDHKVAVQAWTIMAAGGAAALFLLLLFLRIALGRVPPAPPQEEGAHH